MPDSIKKALGSKENFKELFKPGFKTHKQDSKGNYITDDNGNYIRVDESIPGKLIPKVVTGGCILKERPFQISIQLTTLQNYDILIMEIEIYNLLI